MKHLLLLLLLAVSSVHAERPDLERGIVIRQSTCMAGKIKLICVAVMVDDKLYKVYLDEKGERTIYWLSPKGDVLVYSRSSV